MAKKSGSSPQAMRNRAAKTAAAMTSSAKVAESPPKKKTNPVQFFKEVRAETRKITWTTRKETWVTSVMVALLVALSALFFAVVDAGMQFGVGQILKLASLG